MPNSTLPSNLTTQLSIIINPAALPRCSSIRDCNFSYNNYHHTRCYHLVPWLSCNCQPSRERHFPKPKPPPTPPGSRSSPRWVDHHLLVPFGSIQIALYWIAVLASVPSWCVRVLSFNLLYQWRQPLPNHASNYTDLPLQLGGEPLPSFLSLAALYGFVPCCSPVYEPRENWTNPRLPS